MTSELLTTNGHPHASTTMSAHQLTESGRPKRQCRKEHVSYADNNDIDLVLEHHWMEHHHQQKRPQPQPGPGEVQSSSSRKRKASVDIAEASSKRGGRKSKSQTARVVVQGIITPNTSTSNEKTKTDDTSNASPNATAPHHVVKINGHPDVRHLINDEQKKSLIASMSNLQYELKFVDMDRLQFEMETRDDAHLDPEFRRKLVDEWVSTSYDHEFHLERLMDLAKDPNQKHGDSILHTICIMHGLLNVKKENNLLKLKMKDQLCDRHGCTSKATQGT